MIYEFVTKSTFARFMINSLMRGNKIKLRGKGNLFSGRLSPVCLRCDTRVFGGGNQIKLNGGSFKNVSIFIEGDNNTITLGNVRLKDVLVFICGNGSAVNISDNCVINNAEFGIEGNGSEIKIEKDVQIGGFAWLNGRTNRTDMVGMYAMAGKKITADSGSRISDGVIVRNSDSHTIKEKGGNIINPPRDVFIGKNVWICSGALLLKGSRVGNGSIVGARAVTSKDFSQTENALIAGIPAKIIKEDVYWSL